MEYVVDKDNIVILGGWNPSILQNPAWVGRFLFDQSDQASEQSLERTQFLTNRIEFGVVRLTVNPPRLGIGLARDDSDGLDAIRDVAFNIADHLPHTPVNAIGINFAYDTESHPDFHIESELTRLLLSTQDQPPSGRKIGFTWSFERHTLNLTIQSQADEKLRWDFNFHHKLGALADLKEILEDRPLNSYRHECESLVHSVVNGEAQLAP